jgi:hypothetical protein
VVGIFPNEAAVIRLGGLGCVSFHRSLGMGLRRKESETICARARNRFKDVYGSRRTFLPSPDNLYHLNGDLGGPALPLGRSCHSKRASAAGLAPRARSFLAYLLNDGNYAT